MSAFAIAVSDLWARLSADRQNVSSSISQEIVGAGLYTGSAAFDVRSDPTSGFVRSVDDVSRLFSSSTTARRQPSDKGGFFDCPVNGDLSATISVGGGGGQRPTVWLEDDLGLPYKADARRRQRLSAAIAVVHQPS